MERDRKPPPHVTSAGRDEQAKRRERLAEALRENLKRRKQQARGRSRPPKGEDPKP